MGCMNMNKNSQNMYIRENTSFFWAQLPSGMLASTDGFGGLMLQQHEVPSYIYTIDGRMCPKMDEGIERTGK